MKALLTILFLFLLPTLASADYVEIINNVSSSASTGGNSSSRSSVKVYTEVNGEVIEDFQKEVQGPGGINYEAEKKFEGGKIETKVEVNTDVSKSDFDTSKEEESVSEATSSLEAKVSKSDFDTFRERIRYIFKYVFSLFKF
ncbi:MAG: hypothetical protein V1896_02325 [Candidatus Zambryskibacteria bacterium]